MRGMRTCKSRVTKFHLSRAIFGFWLASRNTSRATSRKVTRVESSAGAPTFCASHVRLCGNGRTTACWRLFELPSDAGSARRRAPGTSGCRCRHTCLEVTARGRAGASRCVRGVNYSRLRVADPIVAAPMRPRSRTSGYKRLSRPLTVRRHLVDRGDTYREPLPRDPPGTGRDQPRNESYRC